MSTTHHTTPYGDVDVSPSGASIDAHAGQLFAWSHRPGAAWPCSILDDLDHIAVAFDSTGLVELVTDGGYGDELPADELSAWASDVLRDVLPKDHPAYFVAVGQFGVSA
jgi:hypothetical protein